MPEDDANDVLIDLGWPEPEAGLEGIDLEGVFGEARFTMRDEGQSGIVMTAEPAT